MKRLLLLIFLFISFFAQAQDAKPVDANNKSLQSSINVTWWYNIVNHKIGMWKGGTYIYNEFFSAKQVQAKIDSLAYVKTDSVTGTSPIVVTKTSQKVFNVSINPADCDNNGYMLAVDKCFLDSLKLKRGILKGDSALIKTQNGDSVTIGGYGALYNWYVTQGTGTGSLSSSDDWVVPTQIILEGLLNSIDTYDSWIQHWPLAGGKLKEIGLAHWNDPNVGATNEYGFNAIAPGIRDSNGSFIDGDTGNPTIKDRLLIWTSTVYDEFSVIALNIFSFDSMAVRGYPTFNLGNVIRLCNPSTLLEEGATGTYTGNDGTVYNTIVINGVEWLSQNLEETQHRDHSWIHGYELGVYTPISNATWAALTTEGMCYYGNDTINGGITTKIPVFTNIYLGDTIQIPNITNLATKDTLTNYWNKQEITEPDTTRWSLGYAAYLWGNHASAGYLTGLTVDSPLSGLGTAASHLTVDLSSKENAFSKNTGFNLNLGTVTGTVLEGRTFGTAAAAATTDFAPSSVYPATGLTTGYLPYKSATVLANSPIYTNGTNVGIGTTTPSAKLHVNGIGKFGRTSDDTRYFSIDAQSGFLQQYYYSTVENQISYTGDNTWFGASSGTTGIGAQLYLKGSTGNVGIGTTNPGSLLTVNGIIDSNVAIGGGYYAHDAVSGGNNIFSLTRQGNDLALTAWDGIGFSTSKTSPSTAYSMFINTSGNVGIQNSTSITETLTIGTAGTGTPNMSIAGATSGKLVQQASAVAGTPTITWGTTSGTPALISQAITDGVLDKSSSEDALFHALAGKVALADSSGVAPGSYVTGKDFQVGLATKQATITTGTTAQYFRGDLSLATFPTISGSNTGDQTLTIAGTTSPTIALSGSNTATFSAGTGITLGQSAGTITITGGTIPTVVNPATQSLSSSGGAIAWNLSSGVNMKTTLTENTTITLSNATDGMSGTMYITNAAGSSYTLTIAGYTNYIHNSAWSAANVFVTSGAGSKKDSFSFKYNASEMYWNGGNEYK